MKHLCKTTAAAVLGLWWLALPGAAHAYAWDFTLTPTDAATLIARPGDSIDVFATVSNQGGSPLTIIDTGGCLDFPGLCTGNEGVTVNLDVSDPTIAFDYSTALGPPATVVAGGQLTFLIGTLRVLNGAPVGLDFNVTIDVTPDPVITLDATGVPVVTDTADPGLLSLTLPVHIAAVPEPESWVFLAIGVGVLWRRRARLMKAVALPGKI